MRLLTTAASVALSFRRFSPKIEDVTRVTSLCLDWSDLPPCFSQFVVRKNYRWMLLLFFGRIRDALMLFAGIDCSCILNLIEVIFILSLQF